jgi:transcriptional regulator with XRE-family HTH domain
MGRTLDEWIASLPADERRRIEARAAELIAEEMSLRDLRKAMKKTQVAIAKRLKVRQHGVSKIEQRTDMLLSTLRGYVRALGGELHLVAEFKDRPAVRLTEIGGIADENKAPNSRSRARKRAAA